MVPAVGLTVPWAIRPAAGCGGRLSSGEVMLRVGTAAAAAAGATGVMVTFCDVRTLLRFAMHVLRIPGFHRSGNGSIVTLRKSALVLSTKRPRAPVEA